MVTRPVFLSVPGFHPYETRKHFSYPRSRTYWKATVLAASTACLSSMSSFVLICILTSRDARFRGVWPHEPASRNRRIHCTPWIVGHARPDHLGPGEVS